MPIPKCDVKDECSAFAEGDDELNCIAAPPARRPIWEEIAALGAEIPPEEWDRSRMHFGRLDRDTAAGRVFDALADRLGEWVDGWTLTLAAHVTAVGTRASEVRHALRERLELGVAIEHRCCDGQQHYYRLVDLDPLVRWTPEALKRARYNAPGGGGR